MVFFYTNKLLVEELLACCWWCLLLLFPSQNCQPSNGMPKWSVAAKNCMANLAPPSPTNHTAFFPWMAAIEIENSNMVSKCTGSIISAQYVLTAAHCVVFDKKKVRKIKRAKRTMVFVGAPDKGNALQVRAAKLVAHPEYTDFDYDIGLIKLKKPLNFNEHVAPICLGGKFNVDELAWIAGWGHQKAPTKCNDPMNNHRPSYPRDDNPTKLLSGRVQIVANEECTSEEELMIDHSFKNSEANEEQSSTMCTKGADATTQQGDSGGPLMQYDVEGGSGWRQLGIVSNGRCPKSKNPTVYTKVSAYCDWIRKETHGEAECAPDGGQIPQ